MESASKIGKSSFQHLSVIAAAISLFRDEFLGSLSDNASRARAITNAKKNHDLHKSVKKVTGVLSRGAGKSAVLQAREGVGIGKPRNHPPVPKSTPKQ
eukprot:708810-Amphidinium_carterae.1